MPRATATPGFIAAVFALLFWTTAPAAESLAIGVTNEGWTITTDSERGRLAIQHEQLGTLVREVQLCVQAGEIRTALTNWKATPVGPGRLLVKTSAPASTWSFDLAHDYLMISSTAPGAVLIGQAPVSNRRGVARLLDSEGAPVTWQGTGEVAGTYGGRLTQNPSFLPRNNPECMYFALGQVAGLTFHSLFDQNTDTGIRFSEGTEFSHPAEAADYLNVVMPLPGPRLVRLLPHYYTKTLGVPRFVPFDDSIFARAPMVWCSWTSYYGDVTEEAVVKNADWLAENLKPYGFQYVQIDDGYDRGSKVGHNWIDHWDQAKFPKGPAWIAGYIRSKGLHPGLWLVPNAYAGAVEAHPDWYLRDRNGKIVLDYDTPALDSSHPEVLGFLEKLFGALRGWGFDYFKFDGEHAVPKYAPPVDASRLHDKTADPLAVYQHRLEVIRKAIGPNTFVEGCPAGTPLNGIGFFNWYFNGQDVYNNWNGMYALFSSINANAFLNRRVVYVMPGEGIELGERMSVADAQRKRPPGVVQTAETREDPLSGFGVTLAEARTLVSVIALSGVVYPLAGVMPELPPERLALLQKTMPTMPIAPLDLFSRGTDVEWDTFKHVTTDDYIHHYPEIIDLKVNANSVTYDVVALPNWRTGSVRKTLSLGRQLGLEPAAQVVAFDFWNQALVGVVSNQTSVEIGAHDTRVLSLHPLLNHPQLVGVSRHIAGAFSVENLAWDAGQRRLRGTSEIVPGKDYTLFIYVPPGSRAAKPLAFNGSMPVPTRQEKKGALLSVTFNSLQSPVSWQITF